MKIIEIEPFDYGGRLKKTATHIGVQIISDNLVDSLTTLVTVFSKSSNKETEEETSEILETFNESLSGKDYDNLDTISGIDIKEEIVRAILKKINFKPLKHSKNDTDTKK